MYSLVLLGISLNVSGLLTFLFMDKLFCSNFPLLGSDHEPILACSVSSFCLLLSKSSLWQNWVAFYKINPLYVILSDFEFGNSLGGGTSYDSFNILRYSGSDNFSREGKLCLYIFLDLNHKSNSNYIYINKRMAFFHLFFANAFLFVIIINNAFILV